LEEFIVRRSDHGTGHKDIATSLVSCK
jgi:hypothetical protein